MFENNREGPDWTPIYIESRAARSQSAEVSRTAPHEPAETKLPLAVAVAVSLPLTVGALAVEWGWKPARAAVATMISTMSSRRRGQQE